jgi:hypothetical protein
MKHRHLSLRLPLYRPDLNPIELVWGEVKGKVAHQNIGQSYLQQKKTITREILL